MIKVPFIWVGGKSMWVSVLLQYIPQHELYVEVFGGSGALLFAKEPSKVEVYNDVDENVVNFFRVLRDKEKFEELRRLLVFTPYSRKEFEDCVRNMNVGSDVERAYRFFVVQRMCFNGMNYHVGWKFPKQMRFFVQEWFNGINDLWIFYRRLTNVHIECVDFSKIFDLYDTEDTFFFCDPPYLNVKTNFYKDGFGVERHQELLDRLLSLKGKVMLCGYVNDLYGVLENNGWRRVELERCCFVVGKTKSSKLQGKGALKTNQKRRECFWVNYMVTPNFL